MSKRVYIGVGHGGSDPGATANGLKEKDLNLSTAKHLKTALERCGVSVKMSRTTDAEVFIETRIKEANAFNADLSLDIHYNAGGGDGAEVYYTRFGGKGKTLANNILKRFGEIGQNSRGAKIKLNSAGNDYFGFVRQTNMPAVLVECAFVDNKKDIAIADTEAERKKIAEAICKAICDTLKIKYVAEPAYTYTVTVSGIKTKAKAEKLVSVIKDEGYSATVEAVKK